MTISLAGENVEQQEPSCGAAGSIKWHNHCVKHFRIIC